MRIEIRRANPEDADTLTEIAHAAKRHWNYPESWIEQWQTDLTISGEFIRTHEVFAATINGAVIGCCALVMTDSVAEIEHMWIRPEQMGSGVGRALFEHARARAVERGASALELSADPYAEGFYARMGAKRIGEIPVDMDGQSRVLPRMRIEL
ncbi:MAG TPA: GNAT family N-acetyltransferase [Pyrinomonadaceae bacterium]